MSDFMSGTLFGMLSGIVIGVNLAALILNHLNKKKINSIKNRVIWEK